VKLSPLVRRLGALALPLMFFAASCDRASQAGVQGSSPRDPELIRISVLPDENASKLIRDNEGLKQYLEARLGKKVEIHVFTNYTAMIEAFRAKNIDLCYFGPLSYCIAVSKGAEAECFACKLKDGLKTYRSVIITHVESGIQKLADIKGRTMGYGDIASTSSHLIPKCELARAGVPESDYHESFLGKHDVVAVNVLSRSVDAGALSKPIFEGLLRSGKIDRAKIRVLQESPEIPDYPWAMQRDLVPGLKDKIRKAFYELKDPAILKPLKADGFAEIADEEYNVIREAARILNKNLATLEK
jgi:phosphonate transport system substrate-binding protein